MADRIEIDVRNAAALGLSYGRYKALGYTPGAKSTCEPVKKYCPVCGGAVTRSRAKFCSEKCAAIHKKEYDRRYSREHYSQEENAGADL